MMLVYKVKTNSSHLIFGLKEKIKTTKEQQKQMAEIISNIENIDAIIFDMLKKFEVNNISEAMEKAKTDENLDKELVYFMNKTYPSYQKKIIDMVEEFNKSYCPNYEQALEQVKKS